MRGSGGLDGRPRAGGLEKGRRQHRRPHKQRHGSASSGPRACVRASRQAFDRRLAFAKLSGDAEQDYFADGMVEEVVTALSRFRSIFVIASGSSLSFNSKTVSPQDAARQLDVRYVLDGRVRKRQRGDNRWPSTCLARVTSRSQPAAAHSFRFRLDQNQFNITWAP